MGSCNPDNLWRGWCPPLHSAPLSLHSITRHACNTGYVNPKSSNFIYLGRSLSQVRVAGGDWGVVAGALLVTRLTALNGPLRACAEAPKGPA
jgi:hypothetical protein